MKTLVKALAVLVLAAPNAACAPLVQSYGPTLSIGIEYDDELDRYSPRIGLGAATSYGKGTVPKTVGLLAFGGSAGAEVSWSPLLEAVELVGHFAIDLPLFIYVGPGFSARAGVRWDTLRDGDPFVEIGLTMSPVALTRLPPNFCDQSPPGDQECPDGAVTMNDTIAADAFFRLGGPGARIEPRNGFHLFGVASVLGLLDWRQLR